MKTKILVTCLALCITYSDAAAATSDVNLYACSQERFRSQFKQGFFEDLYSTIKPYISSLKKDINGLPAHIADEWLFPDPQEDTPVLVRFADYDELCTAEHTFTQRRLSLVQQSFNKLLNNEIPINKIPRIALCCSGGGYRAMLATLGFLKALQDIGMLDCTTYMAGLSGSTWAMAGWIASQQSLDTYIAGLPKKLCNGLEAVKDPELLNILAKQLLNKAMHGQFISLIDIYGPTLANSLLTDSGMNRLTITLSKSHAHIADGSLPLPIYTAVTPNVNPYEWLEFTPFEAGSSYQKAYIPTQYFGRKFKSGTSVNFAREQSLGYMMGVFGSAFEFDLEDAVRQTPDLINTSISSFPPEIQPMMHRIIDDLVSSPLDRVRLAPSSLPNFTYKTTASELKENKTLTLVDAGLAFNLPFPPLLREERQVNIILVCDASADITNFETLQWVEEYMQLKGLKFPSIDYATAVTQTMSIFKNEQDPACPIVVYFPCIKNDAYSTTFDPGSCETNGYCNTKNFTYTATQINELMGLSEFTVKQYADQLVELVKGVVELKA